MKPEIDYTLYLVTDRELMSSATIEESVDLAIRGGVTLVQLREKEANSKAFYEMALRVKEITDQYQVPLIINDRVDIALAVDAAGVHVGQSDLPAAKVRELIGPDKIIGVSAGNLKQALAARAAGADYLGVGAMYATGTKTDAIVTGRGELWRICAEIGLPVVIIGGINEQTITEFQGIPISGAAIVSAIVAKEDVEGAARNLKELICRIFTAPLCLYETLDKD